MSDTNSTWDDVRRITDELELKIHLASMEARDRWHALQPRLKHLEQKITRATDRAEKAIEQEITALGKALRDLRDDLAR